MKVFKYEIGDEVVVNQLASRGMPAYVGRKGIVNKHLSNGSFDYELDFSEGVYGRFKETELDGETTMTQVIDKDLHKKIIEEIHDTYLRKNADYGNSFGDQFIEHGLLSAVIRLDDKMRRLKQLNKQAAQVKEESIRDTVLDLANYAIMTVMELDKLTK